MSRPKFVPNRKGFADARKLPGVQAELLRIGGELARDAGPGFEAVAGKPNPEMARAYVQPEDGNSVARAKNARDQLLLRALGRRSG